MICGFGNTLGNDDRTDMLLRVLGSILQDSIPQITDDGSH